MSEKHDKFRMKVSQPLVTLIRASFEYHLDLDLDLELDELDEEERLLRRERSEPRRWRSRLLDKNGILKFQNQIS